MHCDEFKLRLDAVLDERLPPESDAALAAHARRCLDCAELMSAERALLGAVRKLPSVSPPPDFSVRVLQAWDAQRGQRQRTWLWGTSALAVAATVLIAALVWRHPAAAPGPIHPSHFQPPDSLVLAVGLAQSTRLLAHHISDEQLVFVDELAAGFRPATRSVNSALHALWRTLPGRDLALEL